MTLDDVAQEILTTGHWSSTYTSFHLVSIAGNSKDGYKCILSDSSNKIRYSHIDMQYTKLNAVYYTLIHLQSMGYLCNMKDRAQLAKRGN